MDRQLMRLLICTQALDPQDPILGFFARWVEEFKKRADVEVITLRDLGPHNKLRRALRLLSLVRTYRYDAVFVHMNPEYLVVAGWYWRARGIPVALWYTHKHVDLKLRIATCFANKIFTASKESFRLPTNKVEVVGHGIDTAFFTPDASVPRGMHYLSVGRLTKSKRHDRAIDIAVQEGKDLRIVGEGPERAALEEYARKAGARVRVLGAMTQEGVRNEYRQAAALIHTSETGSLDKVVLEALACGCPVRTEDGALKYLESKDATYVREHHSLPRLISHITAWYA